MNFVGSDRIFCVILVRLEWLLNVDALRKYECGVRSRFAYLPWSSHEDGALDTPYRTRTLTNGPSMFVVTVNVPLVRASYRQVLNKFGMMDVEWCLGGKLDRASM